MRENITIELDGFPGRCDPIALPYGWFVDVSIQYRDHNGELQTFPRGNFCVTDPGTDSPQIILPQNTYWPATVADNDTAVIIRYCFETDATIKEPDTEGPDIEGEIDEYRGITSPPDNPKTD